MIVTAFVPVWQTQIRLDPAHWLARKDCYRDGWVNHDAMHHRTMSLFGDGLGTQPRAAAGLLWRADPSPTGPVILLQSAIKPATELLPDGYAYEIRTADKATALARVRAGMQVRYRIAINPSRSISGEKRRKVGVEHGDIPDWWTPLAARNGLAIHTLDITPRPVITNPQRLRLWAAQLDGTATITDPDTVTHALVGGIGQGRPYGCGLLSIAPYL